MHCIVVTSFLGSNKLRGNSINFMVFYNYWTLYKYLYLGTKYKKRIQKYLVFILLTTIFKILKSKFYPEHVFIHPTPSPHYRGNISFTDRLWQSQLFPRGTPTSQTLARPPYVAATGILSKGWTCKSFMALIRTFDTIWMYNFKTDMFETIYSY